MSVCLRVKSGVLFDVRTPHGAIHAAPPAQRRMLSVCEQATEVLRKDLTITCGTDSHGVTDPHSRGTALDLRTRDLTQGQILALHKFLKDELGADFTVLYEVPEKPVGVLGAIAYVNPKATASHIHVQVRKGYPGAWPDGGKVQ